MATAGGVEPIRRFFKNVTVKEFPETGQAEILLDNRVLKTPAKKPLIMPTMTMAAAVAREWESVGDYIAPHKMPLMTLATTTIDVIDEDPAATVGRVMAYLGSDSVCIREGRDGELYDAVLIGKQQATEDEEWDVPLGWFEKQFDVKLAISRSLAIEKHSEADTEKVAEWVRSLSLWSLASLEVSTANCKSLVLGACLLDGDLPVEKIRYLAMLEEELQQNDWGMAEGDHDVSKAQMEMWLGASRLFHKIATQG